MRRNVRRYVIPADLVTRLNDAATASGIPVDDLAGALIASKGPAMLTAAARTALVNPGETADPAEPIQVDLARELLDRLTGEAARRRVSVESVVEQLVAEHGPTLLAACHHAYMSRSLSLTNAPGRCST